MHNRQMKDTAHLRWWERRLPMVQRCRLYQFVAPGGHWPFRCRREYDVVYLNTRWPQWFVCTMKTYCHICLWLICLINKYCILDCNTIVCSMNPNNDLDSSSTIVLCKWTRIRIGFSKTLLCHCKSSPVVFYLLFWVYSSMNCRCNLQPIWL